MRVSDGMTSEILRSMGVDVDGKQPSYWITNYYHSKMFLDEKYEDGFLCSRCGRHSWSKKKICDGCGAIMENI